jgi:hypothetical protein
VRLVAKLFSCAFFVISLLLLPVAPFIIAALTGQRRFAIRYLDTIRRFLTHLGALWENRAVERYVVTRGQPAPRRPQTRIAGFCNRCGSCCLDRRCLFLEKKSEREYLCGIYGHWLRELTNCGTYPLTQEDIDLYNCPTYYIIQPVAITRRRPVARAETLDDEADVVNL